MKRFVHLAFAAYVLLDAFYLREILFEATLPITRSLQTNYGTPWFISFNRFMAGLLNPDMCALLNIFYFCMTPDKYRALKQMLFQCISLYALIFYKIIMGDPRPYFVDPQIKGWECYADFGNPSGHSTSVWMFYGIILTEICRDLTKRQSQEWQKKLTKTFSVILFVFLHVGIVFCRIFLGVHSLNQVLIGSIFGMYVYFIYINYTESLMERLFEFMRSTKISFFVKSALISIAFVVSVQVPVYLYEIFKREVPQVWRENIFQSCPQFEDHQMFYKVCFKGCSTITIVFGTLFAILCNDNTKQIMLTQFSSEKYQLAYKVVQVKNFAKAFLSLLIFVATFITFYVVAPLHKVFPSIDQVYGRYYSLAIVGFVGIFLLCLCLPKLYAQVEPSKQDQLISKKSEVKKGVSKKHD